MIDSVLRGMDIPKVYLRARNGDGVFSHAAVDGQQRLRALWEFRSGALPLEYSEPLTPVEDHPVAGLKYNQVHDVLKARFDAFEVSAAEISAGTNDDTAQFRVKKQHLAI